MSCDLEKAKAAIFDIKNYYNPSITEKEFYVRYAGFYGKDTGKRLSVKSLVSIWTSFVRTEADEYFAYHNFTLDDVLRLGIDRFVYTLGWTKPKHVKKWRTNKYRLGMCCECQGQFIPLILDKNLGLCNSCRPKFDSNQIHNFITVKRGEILRTTTEETHKALNDFMVSFFSLFYYDTPFRKIFLRKEEDAHVVDGTPGLDSGNSGAEPRGGSTGSDTKK